MRPTSFFSARRAAALLAAGLVLTLGGCGKTGIEGPHFDAASIAGRAMAQCDANKDGALDKKECEACPALLGAFPALDADKDGKISRDELAKHLEAYNSSQLALTSYSFKVKLRGKPLADAVVTLVPEKFMGDVVQAATGTTDKKGRVAPTIPDAGRYPGVRCGFYRVEVSKKDAAGSETIPARYNSQTGLGVEVGPDEHHRPGLFELK